MGFLDFLLGKKQAPKDGAALPAQGEKTPSLQELEQIAESERAKKLSESIPKLSEIIARAKSETDALRDAVHEFSLLQLDPMMLHYDIARQMKPEFERRAPETLDALKFPKEQAFDEYKDFQARLADTIAKFTKISVDNRYLLILFQKNFIEIGARMKTLAKHSDGLLAEIKNAETQAKPQADFLKLVHEAKTEEWRAKRATESEKEAHEQMQNAKQKISNAQNSLENTSPLSRLRQEISQHQKDQENARQAIADLLSPLSRVLKKHAKTPLEKRVSKACEEYAENPVQAALNEPAGQPLLSEIASGISSSLDLLEKDEKAKAKARAIMSRIQAGELSSLVQKIAACDAGITRAQKNLEPLLSAERELEAAQKELASLEKSHSKAKLDANNSLQQAESKKRELEKKASELLHAQVKIA